MSSVSACSALASGCVGACVERAGVPGGQHVDDVGAERDGLGDGGVVGDAAVDEVAAADPHRREHGGDGGAGEDRVDRVAVRRAAPPRRCATSVVDDVQGDGGVLQPVERQMRRRRAGAAARPGTATRPAPARPRRGGPAWSGNTSRRRSPPQILAESSRAAASVPCPAM